MYKNRKLHSKGVEGHGSMAKNEIDYSGDPIAIFVTRSSGEVPTLPQRLYPNSGTSHGAQGPTASASCRRCHEHWVGVHGILIGTRNITKSHDPYNTTVQLYSIFIPRISEHIPTISYLKAGLKRLTKELQSQLGDPDKWEISNFMLYQSLGLK